MSELSLVDNQPKVATAVQSVAVSRNPILITVQEVLFSTAAALRSRRRRSTTRRRRPARSDTYLGHFLMEREMRRL
jgi:hypothetical protein